MEFTNAERPLHARPLSEWHEDVGPVLWWKFPIAEPLFAGTPLDSDWPGYHTHFTAIEIPVEPCEHLNWVFGVHGRRCPCGALMVAFGD